MYDAFLSNRTALRGWIVLDVACNNGYFPVRLKRLGMSRAVGQMAVRTSNILCNS